MLDSGVVLSERYRLDERVATGGMGDVWRGTDLVLGRRVAVKVLLPSLLADPDFITRFRAEARMMAALRHPGIVQVYDSGEDTLDTGGQANYLVMEYVDGEPLSARLNADGRLPAAETMSVVAQVAEALHAAHAGGIVHRDVKPSNLLVQSDGTVVLVDFGVARSVAVTSITSPNAVPGTALYMAPEQAAGRPVSAATDVYALGAVAYHCVAGHTPFAGDNALEVAVKHLNDEVPPLPADVPRPVAELIERALAKDPADRYPDAEAFAQAARAAGDSAAAAGADPAATAGEATAPVIAAAAAGAPRGPRTLPDMPVVPTADAGSAPSRWRAPALGAAAAVLLAVVGLTAMLAFRPEDGPPSTDATSPATPAVAPVSPTAEERASTAPTAESETERTTRRTPSSRPRPTAEPSSETGSPQPTMEPTPEPTEPPATDPSVPAATPSADPPPEGSA